jgi:hypothetical protein
VPKAGHVAVVDRDKRPVIATWKTSAGSNFPMALDEEGRRLPVGGPQAARLLVLETESGKELAALDCAGDADDLHFDPATKRLFVSGGEGALDVFSTEAAPKRLSRITPSAGARACLLDPGTGLLYLAVPHRGAQAAELRVCRARPQGVKIMTGRPFLM